MKNIREYFPILQKEVNGYPLTFFDNASTTQKPLAVIDAMTHYYTHQNANVKRGIYQLSEESSMLYDQARQTLARLINADYEEFVFTAGTTESINFIADAWGRCALQAGDEILVTELEHHSNFLPWQRLAARTGATLNIVPVDMRGMLDYEVFEKLVTEKTKLIAVTYQSNVTGIKTDMDRIMHGARRIGAKVLVDAAQIIGHQQIDVKKIGCDFLAFSGHKMFGPTGIGGLYIKKDMHAHVEPYQVGGGMVFEVGLHQSTFLDAPYKFEAGTPKIAEAVALGAAVNFMQQQVYFDEVQEHETQMTKTLVAGLATIPEIRIIGDEQVVAQGHVVSFVHDTVHAHDLAAYVDQFGICIRAGNHCTQPLHKKLGINSSARVSFAAYNTMQEVEFFIEVLQKLSV